MITLYGFGPRFGLPDPSPFVMKAEMLLKLSGLAYRLERGDPRKAPKGKLPFIRDDDQVIADSTFIRLHLEQRYGIDFDALLSPAERGIAWSIDKLCEDHLYWLLVAERWTDDATFARGAARFFDVLPGPLRPLVKTLIRRKVRRDLAGQGVGRHGVAEQRILAERALAAIAAILDDRPFILGAQPCGVDATLYAFLRAVLCAALNPALCQVAQGRPQLAAYCVRLTTRFYPSA